LAAALGGDTIDALTKQTGMGRAALLDGLRVGRGRNEQIAPNDLAAIALFLMAPMRALSMAPPAPPAMACEIIPPILRLPDCAAVMIVAHVD
jgi:hypothetical protein